MGNRIKIFVDAHVFDHEFQGSRTYIKEIYKIFILNNQFHFYFAAHNLENLRKEFGENENVDYVQYRFDSSSIRLLFEIPLLIKKHKVDYAHFQYIVPPVKFCKYIVTTHDVLFLDYKEEFSLKYRITKYWLYRLSIMRANIITTVSEYSKNAIHKHLKVKLSKIQVVPNAVGPNFFQPYNPEDSRKYIAERYNVKNYVVVVSRIEPRKNLMVVLKVFERLLLFKKGYSLVFIGKKSINDKLFEKEIKNLSSEDRQYLHFFENISEHDLIHFYKASLLSVYPSKAEGFGIPPLESAALKVPTLCSEATAMSDFNFFEDDFFDPNNIEQIEAKISAVLINGKSELSLNRIFNAILNKYSWQLSVNLLSSLIINDFEINSPAKKQFLYRQ